MQYSHNICPVCTRDNSFVNACGCDPGNVPTFPFLLVVRRLFSAANHPPESPARAQLNRDVFTSEYMPSYRYMIRAPFLMSDGSVNPVQPTIDHTFRSRTEAKFWLRKHRKENHATSSLS